MSTRETPRLTLELGGVERQLVFDLNAAELYQRITGKSIIGTAIALIEMGQTALAESMSNNGTAGKSETEQMDVVKNFARLFSQTIPPADLRALIWAGACAALPDDAPEFTVREVGRWLPVGREWEIGPQLAAYAVSTFGKPKQDDALPNPPTPTPGGETTVN